MPQFRPDDRVEVRDASCIAMTEKALLVEVDGEQTWVPRSQVDDDSEVWEDGQEGTLTVSRWIAEQKGWT